MGKVSKPHEVCVDLDAAIGILRRAGPEHIVIAHAMYSPDPEKSERILSFEVNRSRLRKIADTWLKSDDIPKFKAAAEEIATSVCAQCDAMYATSPKIVWAKESGVLHLWKRNQSTMRFGPEHIDVRGNLGQWKSLQTKSFRACQTFLSPGWVLRGLRLKRKLGQSILVTKRREPMAFLDPTYDGLDLMGDTAWLVDLSRAVADATGLPLKMHKQLK